MGLYSRAISLHKKNLRRLINDSEVSLVIKLPVARVSIGVNPFLGDTNRETNETGIEKGPYSCLWYDATTAGGPSPGHARGLEQIVENSAGQFKEATAFAELWLEDVLIDRTYPSGQTWFDKALFVGALGQKFKVLGYAKLGLSLSSPYIIMVALKGGVGYDET